MKRTTTRISLGIALAGLIVSGPAMAGSPTYCDGYARHYANQRAGGNALGGAVAGAVGGAVLGGILGGNKGAGTGAIVGGVGGGVVGGSSWQGYYDRAYNECINAPDPAYAPRVAVPVAPVGVLGTARVYSTVNVRSGPSTTFPKLAVLPAGSVVAVTQCDPYGWCAVNLGDGSYGWVARSLLYFGG